MWSRPLHRLVVVVACLALVAPTGAATTSAVAGEEGCVTRAEKRDARYGMRTARVHRIFGTDGRRLYLVVHNEEKRAYRMCDGRGLTITYLNGELAYKRVTG